MSIKRVLFAVLAAGAVALTPLVTARADLWRVGGLSSAATPRLGPEVQISVPQYPECHRYRADVAFNWNHDEYLVVWHQTWDDGTRQVYARRMSTSGQPVAAPFRVTTMSGNEVHPAVAYNARDDEYLLVWMYDVSGNGTRYDIRGRIIPWNSAGGGADVFVIGNWVHPYDMWYPSVAWGAVHNAYLVTWDSYDATTRQPLRLGSRVVWADGAPDPSATITLTDSPHHSDLVYNAAKDEFLVVWVRSLTHIYGARLNWDGTVARSDYAIYSGSTTQQYPAVTTNEQNRYLVAWEHQYSAADWDILGIELDVNGNQVAPFFVIASTGDVEARPDVAANGATKEWLAVWQRTTAAGDAIWAVAWKSGAVPGTRFPVAAVTFWNNREPAVAADIPGYLVVYEGRAADPTQHQHIYGRMWWPEAVYLPLILRNW